MISIPLSRLSCFVVFHLIPVAAFSQPSRSWNWGNPIDGYCTEVVWVGRKENGRNSGIRITDQGENDGFPYLIEWNLSSDVQRTSASMSNSKNYFEFGGRSLPIVIIVTTPEGETVFENQTTCTTSFDYSELCGDGYRREDYLGCQFYVNIGWLEMLSDTLDVYYRVDGEKTRHFNSGGLGYLLTKSGMLD